MTIGGPFAFVRVWRWVVQVRLGWLSADVGWHREVVFSERARGALPGWRARVRWSDWRGVRGGG